MIDATSLAVALTTAVLLYAIAWYAVRNLSTGWRIFARVALLAVFVGPMLWVQFGAPMRVCHSGFPLVASKATRLPLPSLVNTSFPAVARMPTPPPPLGNSWRQTGLPVL